MKVVIASDSFKGSLSANEAVNSMSRGVRKAFPESDTVLVPVADGGEGTMQTLVTATDGEIKKAIVRGPLGNDVEATYGVLGDYQTCVIEMATASGFDLIPKGELSPLQTTTYGTGQLIKHALDHGYQSFIIAIGGSATNDGGSGMLQALGLKILNENGEDIGFGGGELKSVRIIDFSSFDKRIQNCSFIVASDVQNPLIGLNGASYVFGPQKGATSNEVELLDNNLHHWADVVEKFTGVRLHDSPGAGAAGGIGGAFQAFFPGEMRSGIEVVLNYNQLGQALEGADVVLTGEGKVDYQTAAGKTPLGVAKVAKEKNVPTIVIAGAVGEGVDVLYDYGIVSINSIVKEPMTLEKAMESAENLLATSTEQVIRSYFYHSTKGRSFLCK